MQNLAKVVEELKMDLSNEDIRRILLCCSHRGDRINFQEFFHIMTRPSKDDMSLTKTTTVAAAAQPGIDTM